MDFTQPLLYIELLNGRTDPRQQMQDWGTAGPVLGPFPYVQVTYASEIKTEMPAGTPCILSITGDHLVYYDGVYYGDFGVCAIGDIELESPLKARPVAFDPAKAALPPLNDGSDLETAITEVLQSSSPLGHKMVSLLELKGISTDDARSLGVILRRAIERHLTELANTFCSAGHEECGRALLLEANSLVSE